MKYHEKIDFLHARAFWLPWPMTTREAAGYLLTCIIFAAVSLKAVIWLSVALIDPSLWRLAPALVWGCVLRYALFPAYRRSLVPRDLDRRLVAVGRHG